MGLFQSKQQSKKKSPADDVADGVSDIFDEQYREELRTLGRDYFKKIMDDNAILFKRDLDSTIARVNTEIKDYMTTQLDATTANVNAAITKQLDARLAEYDKAAKDAQDMAVQSLNRNAQTMHDSYQQLSQTLQKTVASQEVMMINVFEENKAQITATQGAQDSVLQSLSNSAQVAQVQTEQLSKTLQKTVASQEAMFVTVFDENKERIAATKKVQESAAATLGQSVKVLQEQYEKLSAMLEKTVANQETMLVTVFQDNMAQIIEHYLLGALGDQYDMKAQLPSIIKQMDANKQAMMDDMNV